MELPTNFLSLGRASFQDSLVHQLHEDMALQDQVFLHFPFSTLGQNNSLVTSSD